MDSSSSSTIAHPPIPNFSHSIFVKLTPDNCFLWKVKIIPYLRGQCLYKFIDDSHPSPKPELDDGTPNPVYDLWLQQDQLVMFALNSFLFEPLIAQVIGCDSACTVWLSLKSTYASISQACLLQTQLPLTSLKQKAPIPSPLSFGMQRLLKTPWLRLVGPFQILNLFPTF